MTRETIPTKQTVIRDVLKLIADAPTSTEATERLLEQACALTGAQGAAFILFDDSLLVCHLTDPQMLPKQDTLTALATHAAREGYFAISDSIDGLPYPLFGLAPLLNDGQIVGVLWLAAHNDLNLEGDALSSLVDGLRIMRANGWH